LLFLITFWDEADKAQEVYGVEKWQVVRPNPRFCLRAIPCWVPLAHTCNPSYSGGRDHGSKPIQANGF
jgi:hypothetical protein